jgi:hypothetical protein
MTDLDEANFVLDKAARQQELLSEIVGFLYADSVERFYVFGLLRKIDDGRCVKLHTRGEVVGLGTRRDVRVDGVTIAEFLVHLIEHTHLPLALGGIARFRLVRLQPAGCSALVDGCRRRGEPLPFVRIPGSAFRDDDHRGVPLPLLPVGAGVDSG